MCDVYKLDLFALFQVVFFFFLGTCADVPVDDSPVRCAAVVDDDDGRIEGFNAGGLTPFLSASCRHHGLNE